MALGLILFGFVLGVCAVLALLYIVLLNPFGQVEDRPPFAEQFPPFRIPNVSLVLYVFTALTMLYTCSYVHMLCARWADLRCYCMFDESSNFFKIYIVENVQMTVRDVAVDSYVYLFR